MLKFFISYLKGLKMLPHLDENNMPTMVDVGSKDETLRLARASGIIKMSKEAFWIIKNEKAKKGPVLQTAVIASIMGAKKTSDLIPMTHPLLLNSIKVDIISLDEEFSYKLIVEVKTKGRTGVEIEALTGVSIGLLTIYDMIKAIDKAMVIKDILLEEKSGGKSGRFIR